MPLRLDTEHPVDLSQPVAHGGPAWPQYEPPTIVRNYRREVEGFNAETVALNTHTGTHVDVPFHFDDTAQTVDERPLHACAGTAVFLDLRDRVSSDAPITAEMLEQDARRVGPGDIAVLVTGWGASRAVSEEYLKRWPYLDGGGARLLVERGVLGVGIDALSIGGWGGPHKGEPSHDVLLSAGTLVIEELRVPDEVLREGRWFLAAFPILLEGCGGAWARACAWRILDRD